MFYLEALILVACIAFMVRSHAKGVKRQKSSVDPLSPETRALLNERRSELIDRIYRQENKSNQTGAKLCRTR